MVLMANHTCHSDCPPEQAEEDQSHTIVLMSYLERIAILIKDRDVAKVTLGRGADLLASNAPTASPLIC